MPETEPPKSKAEFLRAELKKDIKKFCEDRQSNKRKAFHLKIWGTVFSATTTILLGLQGFDHWTTYLKLEAVLAELDYLLADSNGSPKSKHVDALFCKYQQVLEHSTQSWLELRDDKTKKVA